MIQLIRIDDRLLHGQVAYSWKAKLGYEAVLIANDAAANDSLRKQAIKMAAPPGTKVSTKTIEDSIKLLNDPRLKSVKVFVIVSNPKDALLLLKSLDDKPTINLGGMMNKEGAREFAKAVYLSEQDFKDLDEIDQLGVPIETQQVPNEKIQNYESLRNKFNTN